VLAGFFFTLSHPLLIPLILYEYNYIPENRTLPNGFARAGGSTEGCIAFGSNGH
jgi:hypothetical protein